MIADLNVWTTAIVTFVKLFISTNVYRTTSKNYSVDVYFHLYLKFQMKASCKTAILSSKYYVGVSLYIKSEKQPHRQHLLAGKNPSFRTWAVGNYRGNSWKLATSRLS